MRFTAAAMAVAYLASGLRSALVVLIGIEAGRLVLSGIAWVVSLRIAPPTEV